ncbi:MAG: pyridoxamine 5'-phosphate oxidase family protein [Bacteroidia bacterium]
MNSKTKVKRSPKRGLYDIENIKTILDKDFTCHIGFIHDNYPVVIPTLYGRLNNHIYIHGATSSRMLKSIEGNNTSVTITLVNGLVLARSAFHHSLNYESVVLFGKPKLVFDDEKLLGLKVISDQMLKGRWEDCSPPNNKELKATSVLKLEINEASAKIRNGAPSDDAEDYKLNYWAGELPIKRLFEKPIADETGIKNIAIPNYIQNQLNQGCDE